MDVDTIVAAVGQGPNPTVQRATPELLTKDGKIAIPAKYIRALPFSDGVAAIQMMDGKWGYIDPKGGVKLVPKWDQAASFINGLAQVWVGKTLGYIDHSGKYVWEPK